MSVWLKTEKSARIEGISHGPGRFLFPSEKTAGGLPQQGRAESHGAEGKGSRVVDQKDGSQEKEGACRRVQRAETLPFCQRERGAEGADHEQARVDESGEHRHIGGVKEGKKGGEQVLVLLNKLKKDVSTGVLFITHDLGVVAEIADRVIILYSGRKVEEGSIETIFAKPLHPYTVGLMKAVPNVDEDDFDIQPIPGTFPNITEDIGGCRFHPRCPYATERCRTEVPAELEIEPGHLVCCHKVEEEHRK